VLYELAKLGALSRYVVVSTKVLGERLGVAQQTASRWLVKMERLGYVKREVSGRMSRIKIAERGAKLLDDVRRNLNTIFEQAYKSFVIKGYVFTGLGEGRYYTTIPHYERQFVKKLGFKPYPGTLNLRLEDMSELEKSKMLKAMPGIKIEGFTNGRRTYGSATCYRAIINGKVEGAVIKCERTHYSDDVIEIISPVCLRKRLGLKDGDEVEIKILF